MDDIHWEDVKIEFMIVFKTRNWVAASKVEWSVVNRQSFLTWCLHQCQTNHFCLAISWALTLAFGWCRKDRRFTTLFASLVVKNDFLSSFAGFLQSSHIVACCCWRWLTNYQLNSIYHKMSSFASLLLSKFMNSNDSTLHIWWDWIIGANLHRILQPPPNHDGISKHPCPSWVSWVVCNHRLEMPLLYHGPLYRQSLIIFNTVLYSSTREKCRVTVEWVVSSFADLHFGKTT